MKTITFTEFRNHASDMLTAVEHGETLLVVGHGRPIAEVSPVTSQQPSWKRPALRLSTKGAGLASAILCGLSTPFMFPAPWHGGAICSFPVIIAK